MKHILTILLIFSTVCTWQQSFAQKQKKQGNARRLEILFLGDNGHHKPIERVPSLMAALGSKGINFTYTDDLQDINATNLNLYDALLIYANWDSLPPAQEKVLLDYVKSGKALIAVHCASYCFRNSAEYVKMVGGQFWRHKMDSITTTFTQPNHPILSGLKSFTAFDETYLHDKLQADNNVLAVREIKADQATDKPNQKTEPYTWTRTYGKGKVFYTAYGHDERTWNLTGFHDLLEKGILWAVDDKAKKAHAALSPQPFQFVGANLPNYEQRPDPQLKQLALSPEESMKHIQVPADFDLELFASEPNVMHPIAMTWDEKGRLYVLITKDYPNERKESGGSDYILLCEDTNKDGKADKFTRFADGLSIPTGMTFANGGLVVSQAPHLLFLKDTNGDDKADEKKILFTGFGTFDTHAGPSNLHYGFDNWVWGSIGYSGFKGKVGKDSLEFGQGFFRFKPDGSQLEYVTSTNNNTWGLGFNETGDVFGSTANNAHGWYMPIAHQFFNSAKGTDNGSRSTDTHKDMKTITPKVRQVDAFGGFTAAAGHNFYTARAFPKKYWNKIAFVCEPTGHVVHQNNMVKNGTDFSDKEAFNLLAGADEWVSPVFAEVGPDGAVWIADWYSYIIQHNPVPQGFENGSGNAYQTDLRDFTHGRIYRVSWKNAPLYKSVILDKNKPETLIAGLKNNNQFWRMTAQRLLVERGKQDIVPQLIALVKDQSLDEIGINPTAIHALRTLEGLGAITASNSEVLQAVISALKHPCSGVRKTAIQVLPKDENALNALLSNDCLNDKEPLVVLNTLLALSTMPINAEAEKAILEKLEKSNDLIDRWLPDAFAIALTSKDGKLYKKLIGKYLGKKENMPTKNEMSNHAHHQGMSSTEKVQSPTSEKADLVIADVLLSNASPVAREGFTYTIELKNQGKTDIPKGKLIVIQILISGQGNKVEQYTNYIDGIAAGKSVQITKGNNGPWTFNLGYSADKAGEYQLDFQIDKDNKIEEGDKNNNRFSKKVTFQAPPNLTAYVLERASRSYASLASIDSAVSILKYSTNLDPIYSNALLKGLSAGWNTKRKDTPKPEEKTFLTSLYQNIGAEHKERLARLLVSWSVLSPNEISDPNAQVISLKAIKETLKFDKKEFTVTAGKPVEIVFENPDAMQHNIVIGQPYSLETIGKEADKLITQKDGAEKNYVPAIPQVLFSTPLINPNQTYRLKFTAPAEAGEYVFVCTFPGHWRIMNGIMKVVSAVK
ncbi:MAG: ThuA domain-containing protein [Thermoflexibacter sp.]|nr:ThuA domain-containing protein [Thermoflexibacter sp.]